MILKDRITNKGLSPSRIADFDRAIFHALFLSNAMEGLLTKEMAIEATEKVHDILDFVNFGAIRECSKEKHAD